MAWFLHKDFDSSIKKQCGLSSSDLCGEVSSLKDKLDLWNKSIFGYIFSRKKIDYGSAECNSKKPFFG